MVIDLQHITILVLAGAGGGFANALAGGGTLITFPALLAAGLPPVTANVTSTVALCPGYVGGIIAQWRDLEGQARRLALLFPVSMAGSVAGGWLLLHTSEARFVSLVPPLLLLACALLAAQDHVRGWLGRRAALRGVDPADRADTLVSGAATLFVAGIYGGYLGPGVSVMFMAVLGLVLVDTLTRLNALKSALGLAVNLGAALFFAGSGRIVWPAVAAVAAGALCGGMLGGRLAGAVRPETLRRVIIAIGSTVAVVLLMKN